MFHKLHSREGVRDVALWGIACDQEGVFFAGGCALVTPSEVKGRKVYQVRSLSEINKTLSAGLGVEVDFSRHFEALERVAELLNEGQLGEAQITALQMRLPGRLAEALSKSQRESDDLQRFNDNHKPPGPGGGQFTSGVSTGAAQGGGTPRLGVGRTADPGAIVRLPNGQPVRDPHSSTGYLRSPVADLSQVAEAGRLTGRAFRTAGGDPETRSGDGVALAMAIVSSVGTGGTFDYQRSGDFVHGFQQLRQFRDVSNFNVGLFMQQTGLFSREQTLVTAGWFASLFSSNKRPNQPFGLDPQTAEWVTAGYEAGASGVYGQATVH